MVAPPSSPFRPGLLAPLLLAACGSGTEAPPSEVEPLRPRLISAELEPEVRRSLPERPVALGVGSEGAVVGTQDQVWHVEDGLWGPASVRLEDDESPPGAIHGVTARREGGTWVAAERGLYALGGRYLVPVLATPEPLLAAAEVESGPLEGLWLLSEAALTRFDGGGGARYEAEQPLIEFAASPRRLIVRGTTTEVWVPDGIQLERWPVPGTTVAVAASRDGLWRLDADARLWWLDGAGAPTDWRGLDWPGAAAPTDLEGDGRAVVVAAGDELYRVGPDTVLHLGTQVGLQRLAPGRDGGGWSASGTELLGFGLGRAGFDTVRPLLETECAGCHPDYVDVAVFRPRASSALERLQSGDMPRCGAGQTRCPTPLPPETYAPLRTWIEEGMLP